MLPVARIAQSVEQGIENPRVLGSIPSPGTIFREPSLWLGFCFLEYGLSIELRSIIRPKGLTLRASAKALFNAAPAPVVRVRVPYSEEPSLWLGFCFLEYGLSIELRSMIRPRASPCGPAPVVRVRAPYSEEPAYGGFFAFWGTGFPEPALPIQPSP